MHVLQLACLVGYDRWYLLGSVGCAWAAVGIGWICAVAVLLLPFALWWKVDTSIFEGRHIDLRKSTHRSSKIEGGNIAPTFRQFVTDYCPQRRSIVLYLKILYGILSDEVTHAHIYGNATATPRVTPHVH